MEKSTENILEKILKNQTVVLEKLGDLERRIVELEGKPEYLADIDKKTFDISDLIMLPDHLRMSMIAVIGLSEATAEQVAVKTGRVRNLESSYLNQLVRLGYLSKFRKKRKIHFKPTSVNNGILNIVKKIES